MLVRTDTVDTLDIAGRMNLSENTQLRSLHFNRIKLGHEWIGTTWTAKWVAELLAEITSTAMEELVFCVWPVDRQAPGVPKLDAMAKALERSNFSSLQKLCINIQLENPSAKEAYHQIETESSEVNALSALHIQARYELSQPWRQREFMTRLLARLR